MSNTNGEKMQTDIAPGDKAAWNWGGGAPGGTVEEVKPNDVTATSHRGNEIKKTGSTEDPAVKLSMSGGKPVVKQAHELEVTKEGPKHDQAGTATSNDASGEVKPSMEKAAEDKKEDKKDDKKDEKSGGLQVPKGGRGKSKSKSPAPKAAESEKKEDAKAEEKKDEEKKEDEPKEDKAEAEKPAEKKDAGKKEDKPAAKRGRKPGTGAKPAVEKKEKTKKRAATESGEPRRSKRAKA